MIRTPAIFAFALAILSITGCVSNMTYVRYDGAAIDPAALDQAITICKGAAAQASLGGGISVSQNVTVTGPYGSSYVPQADIGGQLSELGDTIARNRASREIGDACMAGHGYRLVPAKGAS